VTGKLKKSSDPRIPSERALYFRTKRHADKSGGGERKKDSIGGTGTLKKGNYFGQKKGEKKGQIKRKETP